MNEIGELMIETDFNDDSEVISENVRLFDFNTAFAEDLITININEAFESKDIIQPNINYIDILHDKYKEALTVEECSFDKKIINGIVFRVTRNFLDKLSENFGVELANTIDEDGLIIDIDEYLDKLSALYEFFICRRSENIIDYLIRKIFKNKEELFENYKNKLTPKDTADLFYGINKKKYKSANDAAFIYFIDDIISDIVSISTDAYELFKYIAEIDIYELVNNKIYSMLESNGFDITYPEGVEVASQKYFSLLDNKQSYIEVRNSIFLYYTEQTNVKNDSEVIFTKDSKFSDNLLNSNNKERSQ